jgi:hypothetical protein
MERSHEARANPVIAVLVTAIQRANRLGGR